MPAIARLVAADEDTVRDVIHAFNQRGLAALDPRWAGGRPRRISDDDVAFIVATAKARPETLGRPFTHWSVRKRLTARVRASTAECTRSPRAGSNTFDDVSSAAVLEGVHRRAGPAVTATFALGTLVVIRRLINQARSRYRRPTRPTTRRLR